MIDAFKLKKRPGRSCAETPLRKTLFRLTKGLQAAKAFADACEGTQHHISLYLSRTWMLDMCQYISVLRVSTIGAHRTVER